MASGGMFGNALGSLGGDNRQSEGTIEAVDRTINFGSTVLVTDQITRIRLLKSTISPLMPLIGAVLCGLVGLAFPPLFILCLIFLVVAFIAWQRGREKYISIHSSDGGHMMIVTKKAQFQTDVFEFLMHKINDPKLRGTINVTNNTVSVENSTMIGGNVEHSTLGAA
jgi:hypothetical protein